MRFRDRLLGRALQSLIYICLEYGDHRILQAVPQEQRDLLDAVLVDGLELARTAFEEGTPLFEGMEFPPADKVFALTPGIMIDPQPKDKKDPQGKP